jgi:hypothetical protein
VYKRGEIIARSRSLGQRGLCVGEKLDRARALFPAAHFFEHDHPFEDAVWEGVVHRINETTPFLCPAGHGWAFFKPYSFSEACQLAGSLIAKVGLGKNRAIAQFAALRSASGSVLQVKDGVVDRFLASTGVDILLDLGFDEVVVERLTLFGLSSLSHLQPLTKRHLEAQFGTVGTDLYDLLHPGPRAEHVPLYSPPATISEIFDLDGAPLEWLPTNHLIEQLCLRATRRLGNRLCRRITLELKRTDGVAALQQRILKKPTANPSRIVSAASFLLKELLADNHAKTELVLTLGGLQNPSARQASLFFERPPVSSAVKSLEDRFPGAIRRAVVVNPDAPFPEDIIRYEPFHQPSASVSQ